MNDKEKVIAMTAMITIGVVEVTALLLGFNGQLLRWTMIIIAGLGGLMIPFPKLLKTNGGENGERR